MKFVFLYLRYKFTRIIFGIFIHNKTNIRYILSKKQFPASYHKCGQPLAERFSGICVRRGVISA